MAERRVGTIGAWVDVAPGLATFRLKPEPPTAFPEYRAGQYIALTRENCNLTVKVKDADGEVRYELARNEDGSPKTGPVTHSYSIASAPYETRQRGEIEIYVTLEKVEGESLGRFTESLFAAPSHVGDTLGYVDRIVGNFTLDQRASGVENVVMVGTGTGVAPFVAMMKQTAHEAREGRPAQARYTLIHANRTVKELGYDAILQELAAAKTPGFDFQYVRSVSRPRAEDARDQALSRGRANNLFRSILGLPTREEEVVEEATREGGDITAARRAVDGATPPRLAASADLDGLRSRMPKGGTTVMTCGNPALMEDIRRICDRAGFKFEMEEW
jgi:ferredoxin-NADP reductase